MGGSVIYQSIWNGYNAVAQTVSQSAVGTTLTFMAAVTVGAISLLVLITGKNLMFGELSMGDAVTRGVRALVITALLTAGTFNTYVGTVLTKTLPQQLSQAMGTGGGTTTGAAAFDTMSDVLTKMGQQAQAQMQGLQYLGYQIAEWLIEAAAKAVVAMAFTVWLFAMVEVLFFLPVIVLFLPAWLFDRTRAWGERSVGFILGLILTGALVLLVADVFVKQTTTLMGQFSNAAASPPGNPSSLAVLLGQAGVTSPITGQPLGGAAGSTLNGSSAVETMISMLITLLAGFLTLAATSVLAMIVVASGGFSAGGIMASIEGAVTGAVTRIAGAARPPRASAPRRGSRP
jgi:hypothetical protein